MCSSVVGDTILKLRTWGTKRGDDDEHKDDDDEDDDDDDGDDEYLTITNS